jgi:hypothetical protein
MIAYNKVWLDNLDIHHQLDDAYAQHCLDKEEMEQCKKNHPIGFYTPHFFIRLGLFLLTLIITAFSFGLLSLPFFSSMEEKTFALLAVFFGLTAYGALEFMVKKNHFRSGVDDALLWISAAFITGGLNAAINISSLGNAILVFGIAFYLTLRFVDALMSAIACIALLAIFFFSYIKAGDIAKATTPFLIMASTAVIYIFISKRKQLEKYRHYSSCLILAEITVLVCFYLAGNYYIVRETSNSMFNLHLKEGEGIPFGWIFWILTVLIPLLYIIRGIQKKDAVLLRTGLILIAAAVFTIRYYYYLMPIEIAMTIGGIVMIGIAYALIQYLRQPKHGFTYKEPPTQDFMDKLQVESLLISEIANSQQQPLTGPTRFGGGSGGGGGAGGAF